MSPSDAYSRFFTPSFDHLFIPLSFYPPAALRPHFLSFYPQLPSPEKILTLQSSPTDDAPAGAAASSAPLSGLARVDNARTELANESKASAARPDQDALPRAKWPRVRIPRHRPDPIDRLESPETFGRVELTVSYLPATSASLPPYCPLCQASCSWSVKGRGARAHPAPPAVP
jgi:hypothetical protein